MYECALTAKYFSRPLASFALVPNSSNPHPLTSNIMVVNKDGDLELYAIHDTPKQLAWSARGDLALGAGIGLKILEGYKEGENDDEKDGFVQEERRLSRDTSSRGRDTSRAPATERNGASRSPAPQRATSVTRGRGSRAASSRDSYTSQSSLPATSPSAPGATSPFREDEDDLSGPAASTDTLSTSTFSKPTGLSTTRPKGSRKSPAKVGKYGRRDGQSERNDQKMGSLSRTDTLSADDADGSKSASTAKGLSMGNDGVQVKSTSQSRDARLKGLGKKVGVVGLIRADISMVIRRRVKAGYGLSQVSSYLIR